MTLIPLTEHRGDRVYSDQDASHLVMPNGSLVASFDVPFLCAAAPLVLALYRST